MIRKKELLKRIETLEFVVQLLLDYFNLELKRNKENYKLTLRKEVKKNENS